MTRSAVRLLVLALCLVGLSTAVRAERRVALLIGNAAYREAALRDPVDDVAAMWATLTAAGFDAVIARTDLDRTGMLQALRSFEDVVAGADIGVVFYSGHGIEFRGQNYLLPIDARLDTERDVEDQAVNLDRVLESLGGATKLKLVLLDACRSNPFADGLRRVATKGVPSKGLAPVEASIADTLIAYAAAPGHVAFDGGGANSPFTTALVRHLTTPGLDVELALRRVRDDVVTATNHAQIPFKTGSLGGDEILLGGSTDGSASPPPTRPAESTALASAEAAADLSVNEPSYSGPKLVALYDAWSVYTGTNGTTPTCYATSQWLGQNTVGGAHVQVDVFIYHRSSGDANRSVLIKTNFPIDTLTDAFASVADTNISLHGKALSAQTPNLFDDKKLIISMSRGVTPSVYMQMQKNKAYLSQFSLEGFSYALSRVSENCV